MFAVLRYIHQNPIKVGIAKNLEEYVWSSYSEYLGVTKDRYIDKDFVLNLFDDNRTKAIHDFKAFNEIKTDDACLDISERKKRMTDKEASRLIKKKYGVISSSEISKLEPRKREKCVKYLLKKGLSGRQISRVTGISRYFIHNI